MTNPTQATSEKPRDWSVQGYKEYCELCHRNFVLDDLWGDKETPSEDYLKWQEMNKIYGGGTNNAELMIKSHEAQALEIRQLKQALQEADTELRQHAVWWDAENNTSRGNEAYKAAENIQAALGKPTKIGTVAAIKKAEG